jgi:hypothetical protein
MPAGRPTEADPGALYAFAHQFYWDFRGIAEGSIRRRLDKPLYERLVEGINKRELRLTPEEKARHEALCKEEIRGGRLKESEADGWLRSAEDSQLLVNRDFFRERAAQEATKELKVLGEPDVISDLLAAETPEKIKRICEDAFITRNVLVQPNVFRELRVSNWPISVGSMLPSYLSQFASEFIAARQDARFPKSNSRPSSRLKQLWFLSRALAGALYGVSTRTAINLVGSIRPEQMFKESRDGKPARKRMRARRRSRHPN